MADRWEDDVDAMLRTLRDDVPEMDARAFTAGRARLLATIGAPPPAEPVRTQDEAFVLALPGDRRRRSPPLRRAALWLGVAAAVAVVAVGAVALLPGEPAAPGGSTVGVFPEPSPTTPANATPLPLPAEGRPGEPLPPMPADPLNTAGELAANASDLPLQPGQVRYLRAARSQAKSDISAGGTDTEELWIPYDREEEWLSRRTASGQIQGRSDKDFDEKRAKGGRFDDSGVPPQSPWAVTQANIAALPRDPAALYERLRAEVNAELPPGVGTDATSGQEAVGTVIHLLADHTGGVPADLRAALLRTLGYLPDVTVVPDATATDGRRAIALGWMVDDRLVRNELLLDPSTARVVEWRNVAASEYQGYKQDQVITSDLRTEAVVAQLGERP